MIAEHIDEHFVGAVLRLCRENHIPIRRLPRHKLNQLAGADNRGIAAEAASASYAEVDDILDAAAAKGEPPFVVLLDGIEDPHNLCLLYTSCQTTGYALCVALVKKSLSKNKFSVHS